MGESFGEEIQGHKNKGGSPHPPLLGLFGLIWLHLALFRAGGAGGRGGFGLAMGGSNFLSTGHKDQR